MNNGFVNPCSRPGLRVTCYLFLDLQPFAEEFFQLHCLLFCFSFSTELVLRPINIDSLISS